MPGALCEVRFVGFRENVYYISSFRVFADQLILNSRIFMLCAHPELHSSCLLSLLLCKLYRSDCTSKSAIITVIDGTLMVMGLFSKKGETEFARLASWCLKNNPDLTPLSPKNSSQTIGGQYHQCLLPFSGSTMPSW